MRGHGYRIDKNIISLDGKKVGSVRPDGTYQFVDPSGKLRQGTIAPMLQAKLKPRGPSLSGKLRVRGQTLEVIAGKAYLARALVGAVATDGAFSVTVGGKTVTGNAHTTPGAVWMGGKGLSSVITIGRQKFTAVDGLVYEGHDAIGWLGLDRRFRAVTVNGDYFEGHLDHPEAARYLRRRVSAAASVSAKARETRAQ